MKITSHNGVAKGRKMWHVEVGSPQFYGIVAGCVVYVITVVAVLVLLFKSGSVSRMIDEVCG